MAYVNAQSPTPVKGARSVYKYKGKQLTKRQKEKGKERIPNDPSDEKLGPLVYVSLARLSPKLEVQRKKRVSLKAGNAQSEAETPKQKVEKCNHPFPFFYVKIILSIVKTNSRQATKQT